MDAPTFSPASPVKMEQNKKSHFFVLRRVIRAGCPVSRFYYGAHTVIRTRDLFLTKEVLYRLSYMSVIHHSLLRLERVAGIEPASSAWKAEVIATIRHPRKTPYFTPFSTPYIYGEAKCAYCPLENSGTVYLFRRKQNK